MSDCKFRGSIEHTEDTIQRLYRTQYYSYDKLRIILRFAFGLALIATAVFTSFPIWAKGLLLLAGAWFAVSRDFPSQIRADRVLQERKSALPKMYYEFGEKTLRLSGEGSMDIPYARLTRLAQDDGFLYLFISRDSVCMVARDSVSPKGAAELMDFLGRKTGLPWRSEKSLLSITLADIQNMRRGGKKSK